jgi:hypothetical protein
MDAKIAFKMDNFISGLLKIKNNTDSFMGQEGDLSLFWIKANERSVRIRKRKREMKSIPLPFYEMVGFN